MVLQYVAHPSKIDRCNRIATKPSCSTCRESCRDRSKVLLKGKLRVYRHLIVINGIARLDVVVVAAAVFFRGHDDNYRLQKSCKVWRRWARWMSTRGAIWRRSNLTRLVACARPWILNTIVSLIAEAPTSRRSCSAGWTGWGSGASRTPRRRRHHRTELHCWPWEVSRRGRTRWSMKALKMRCLCEYLRSKAVSMPGETAAGKWEKVECSTEPSNPLSTCTESCRSRILNSCWAPYQ